MKTLKIHCFQHVQFEDLGCIANWIDKNGYTIQYTRFYENPLVPKVDGYDWLVVMGGPISVNDQSEFPRLVDEKKAVEQAIENNKNFIGIYLGSQLIANALGESVYNIQRKCTGASVPHGSDRTKHCRND